MSLTAKQLSKSGAHSEHVKTLIREQLRMIDDRLQRHDKRWGSNVVAYDLPMQFRLPGLEEKDAQRIVYSHIIQSLEERGFYIRIALDRKNVQHVMFVCWMTDMSAEELEAMNAKLRSCEIDQDSIPALMSGGALPAPESVLALRAAPGAMTTVQKLRPGKGVITVAPRGGTVRSTAAGTPADAAAAEAEILASM